MFNIATTALPGTWVGPAQPNMPGPFTWACGRYLADDWTSAAQLRAVIRVPDRTLRNWLRDLVEEGAVESRGERKGRRYRLVDRPLGLVPAAGTIAVEGRPPAVAVQPFFHAGE